MLKLIYMKLIYPLILCCLLSISSKAQTIPPIFINFESPSTVHYYTDTLLDPNGVWQIGAPHKRYFDSAYTKPNAAVTLLDSALPPNTKASFIVKYVESYSFNSYIGNVLTFKHKFDLKNHTSGGYVEFSVDSGTHWHGIDYQQQIAYYNYGFPTGTFCVNAWNYVTLDSATFFYPVYISVQLQDSTATGNPYFTGLDTTWRADTIVFPTPTPEKTNQTFPLLWFKFTVFSDSSTAPQSGWMIDDINFDYQGTICIGGINNIPESNLRISPIPALDAFTVSVTDIEEYKVSIIDLLGRSIDFGTYHSHETTLRRGNLAAGTYILQLTDTHTHSTIQKRLVLE